MAGILEGVIIFLVIMALCLMAAGIPLLSFLVSVPVPREDRPPRGFGV